MYSEKLFEKIKLVGLPEIIYTFTHQSNQVARQKLLHFLEKEGLQDSVIIQDDVESSSSNVGEKIRVLNSEIKNLSDKNLEIKRKQLPIDIRKQKLEKDAENHHKNIERNQQQDHKRDLTELNEINKKISSEKTQYDILESQFERNKEIIEMKQDEIAKLSRQFQNLQQGFSSQSKLNEFVVEKWNELTTSKTGNRLEETSIKNLTSSQFKEKKNEIFKKMEKYDMNSAEDIDGTSSDVQSRKIPTQQEKSNAWKYLIENIEKKSDRSKISELIKKNITFMMNTFFKKNFYVKGKRKFLLMGKEYEIYNIKNIQIKKKDDPEISQYSSSSSGKEEIYIATASIEIYDKENLPSIFKRQNCNVKKKLIKDQLRNMFPGFFGRFETVYDVNDDEKEKKDNRKKQLEKTLYKEYVELTSNLRRYEKELYDLDRKLELDSDDIDRHSELAIKIEKTKKRINNEKYNATKKKINSSKKSSLYKRDRYYINRYDRDRYRDLYYGGEGKTRKILNSMKKTKSNTKKFHNKKNSTRKLHTILNDSRKKYTRRKHNKQ